MLALKIFNWKEKESAQLPNTYGARLYVKTKHSIRHEECNCI